MFNDNMFWNAYSNTLFLTLYGTIWALGYSILGAYALSKKRLLFRKLFNFFLVFTMWFSAGIVPQYQKGHRALVADVLHKALQPDALARGRFGDQRSLHDVFLQSKH
jgi:ABC-type glycerol-3-phosphate transport system permease component